MSIHARIFFGLGLLIGIGWLLFGFFGVQALFMDQVVDEVIPMFVVQESTSTAFVVPTVASSIHATNEPVMGAASTSSSSGTAMPVLRAQGSFTQGDSTYTIRGQAMITEQNGIRTLLLTDFDVTNGPDLFVYLVTADSAENLTIKDAVREGRFRNIAVLKGNRGNQTYQLPADVQIDAKTRVTIWCRRFSRHFGSASLVSP